MKNSQAGTTTLEFALVALLYFIVLFGIVEFGRAYFTWNTLNEATRRGARVATVSTLNNAAIANVAVFNDPNTSGNSPVLRGLTTSNVQVRYLNADGTTATQYTDIVYVEVTITGYQHRLLIPAFFQTITAPDFKTILPRESLGAT